MSSKPKPKPQRRAVGYVRISVDREEQTSTKSQEDAIRAYCAAHGWMLVDIVIERGRSAFGSTRSKRPGFNKAMSLVAGGAADTFIVWKLDRAARNTIDVLRFVTEELAEYDAQFVSVTENFDTTTLVGRAMLTFVAALGEMESAQKSERTLSWHEGRRARGDVPAGQPPLGYIKPEANVLEPDPLTAPLVAEAADRLIGGESLGSILRWINDQGVKVSRPGLTTALQSPTMAGLRSNVPLDVQNGVRLVPDDAVLLPGSWEPIIEPEKWHEMRAILRDPSRRTSPGVKLKYPLVPILRCGKCGKKMIRQNQKKRTARYICRGVFDPPGERCLNGITQGPVDEVVTAAVLERLDDADWRSLRASGATDGPDPVEVEAKLAQMWEMVLDNALDVVEYSEAKARWHGELAAVKSDSVDLPDVDSIRDSWDGLTAAEQHLVFRALIRSLVIEPAKRMGRGVDLERVNLELD